MAASTCVEKVALFATRLEQVLLPQERKQRLEQLHFSLSRNEAAAKLREHRRIKAGIV